MGNQPPLSELMSLKGKLAIVTGATAGIGRGIAGRLAEAGADLIIISRTQEDLVKTAEELSRYNVEISTFALDLTKKESIDKLWEELADRLPTVLVNNAGMYPFSEFLETSEELYHKVLNLNLNAVYWMCFHFIKKLKAAKKPGSIVNIGSIEAVLPLKEGLIHYGISKAGVVALTRGLARDYGKIGIRANAVLPGGIQTRGTNEKAKELLKLNLGLIKDAYNFNQRLPIGRLGKPDEVGRVVLFLVSDLSSYMTGATIPVDGGFLSS